MINFGIFFLVKIFKCKVFYTDKHIHFLRDLFQTTIFGSRFSFGSIYDLCIMKQQQKKKSN